MEELLYSNSQLLDENAQVTEVEPKGAQNLVSEAVEPKRYPSGVIRNQTTMDILLSTK